MEQRAMLFGADAARYDRSRPSYPAALIDTLVLGPGARVLDVGCGTGIASRLFFARGCHVFGVEPDVRMADVARAQGLEVDVARFEDWDPEGRRFDVVVSAQAWHWIDPVLGAECARTVLHDGGVLAVLWNVPEHEPAVHEAFDVVYDRYRLPDGSRCSPPAALAEGTDRFAAGIAAAGGFAPPRHEIGTWIQSYTSAEWVDLLPTHSDHCLMEPAVLDDLLAATAEVIESFGGRIDVTYTTHRLTATTVG